MRWDGAAVVVAIVVCLHTWIFFIFNSFRSALTREAMTLTMLMDTLPMKRVMRMNATSRMNDTKKMGGKETSNALGLPPRPPSRGA